MIYWILVKHNCIVRSKILVQAEENRIDENIDQEFNRAKNQSCQEQLLIEQKIKQRKELIASALVSKADSCLEMPLISFLIQLEQQILMNLRTANYLDILYIQLRTYKDDWDFIVKHK
ncbi:hypothetical protein ABPG74_018300 [Tetrahymena malaccensis]